MSIVLNFFTKKLNRRYIDRSPEFVSQEDQYEWEQRQEEIRLEKEDQAYMRYKEEGMYETDDC